MLAVCMQPNPCEALQTFYPTVSTELLQVLAASDDTPAAAKAYFAQQAFFYPPQFFKFTKPLSFTLAVVPEPPVKLLMGQPLLLEVQAKLKHIIRIKRRLQFTVTGHKLDLSESCEPFDQLRELDAAGAVTTILQIKLPSLGRWRVVVGASLVSARLNAVGKPESCELMVDYS